MTFYNLIEKNMEKITIESPSFKKILQYAQNDPQILAVILYGSFTRDEIYNDIDICLILFPDVNNDEKVIEYMGIFPDIFDFSIFLKLPLYIRHRVQKEGKILINKDYNTLFDIYMKNIKDYNLFKPHYDTFLEAVKNG